MIKYVDRQLYLVISQVSSPVTCESGRVSFHRVYSVHIRTLPDILDDRFLDSHSINVTPALSRSLHRLVLG